MFRLASFCMAGSFVCTVKAEDPIGRVEQQWREFCPIDGGQNYSLPEPFVCRARSMASLASRSSSS